MTNEACSSLQDYLDSHSRDRHGQLEYDLRGDFGLDPPNCASVFAFYVARFDIIANLR